MSVDLSPAAIAARLQRASDLVTSLAPQSRLDTKIDLSGRGVAARLREASDLRELCAALARAAPPACDAGARPCSPSLPPSPTLASMSDLPAWLQGALADYASRLRAALGERVREIRLFGSWARSEARPDSDIDVWVLVDRFDAATRRQPYDLAIEILLQHEVDLSPTVMDEAEWALLCSRERRLGRDIVTQGLSL